MLQDTVWSMTLAGIGFVTAVYLVVYLHSSVVTDAEAVKRRFYAIRPWWFGLLIAIILVALASTIFALPYADTHGRAGSEPDLTVDATAHQWYWDLSAREIPVGKDIAFRVHSTDVNHSFAIYNDKNQLLVQTQAMPGYTNIVRYTFTAPGSYKLLCLEYCGLGHHAMMTDFIVTESSIEEAH